ncbi:MAG: molybdopterin dinucleotide binding domain-containing protein, partial [Acidimicrobiales bacterium]
RRSETAQHATGHLAARAGTDYAVLGYIARELLRDGMDEAYVAEWAVDVDVLREAVEPFTADLASEITALPVAELEAFLAAVRRAGRVAIETGTGVSMSKAGNVTQWLTWVVMILTGSMNRPGGVWFHPGFVDRLDNFELPISPPDGRRGPGPDSRPDLFRYMGDYPCAGLSDEINAGNVAAFVNLGGNMVASFPDTTQLVPALRRLEALVSLDILGGETTDLSTHILPVKDQLERADVTIWDFISRHLDAQYTPPVLAPIGERRSMWWVLAEIGRRLGHDLFPELGATPTDDDVLALRISRGRVGLDELAGPRYARRDEERDDAWVDAHVRRLGGWRLAPALLVEQLATLGRLEVGSLVLVPRRQRRHLNAQLRYLGDRPEILIHPDDARQNGIEEGGDVCVRSAHGEVRGPVRLDASVGRGHVSVPHGWGDTNVNVLTSKDDVDPLTGMPRYSGLEVALSAPS